MTAQEGLASMCAFNIITEICLNVFTPKSCHHLYSFGFASLWSSDCSIYAITVENYQDAK